MAADRIERHSRRTRWFHTGAYLVTTGLLVTGWWLYLGGEGHPTPLSRATGLADVRLHVWLGRALAVWAVIPLFAGRRSIATFLRETFRHDHGDGRWLLRWPTAVFTGRFARHEGEFDPGQRVANVLLVGAEVNVVRARHLWPRSLVQPPLTDADKEVFAMQAGTEERRPEEQVEVRWQDDRAGATRSR